jgi:hypothetical protein
MSSPNRSADAVGYHRLALMLVVIGLLFGIDTLAGIAVIWRLWPLLITIMGIGFLGIFAKRGRREAPYLAVGVYLVCFSGLALYCSFTTWTALAMLWPLFITFMGLTLLAVVIFCRRGRLVLLLSLLLISLSAAFFFVFSLSPAFWWVIFVLAGISILIAERAR